MTSTNALLVVKADGMAIYVTDTVVMVVDLSATGTLDIVNNVKLDVMVISAMTNVIQTVKAFLDNVTGQVLVPGV